MPYENGRYIETTVYPVKVPSSINVWFRWISFVNFLNKKRLS